MAQSATVQAHRTNDKNLTHNMTFIGKADVLPKELRAVCSCADLFFARVLSVLPDGNLYHVEVAALSHYFDSALLTQKCHVRTMFLPIQQFAQMLEWDRRLAALTTCDVQEIVQSHMQLVLEARKPHFSFSLLHLWIQFMVHASAEQTPVMPSGAGGTPVREENGVSAYQYSSKQISSVVELDDLTNVSYITGPSVSLKSETIVAVWAKMQHRLKRQYPSIRQFSRLLLEAIYPQLQQDEKKELARVRYVSGPYAAQVEIEPTYAPGKAGAINGCIVNTYIPRRVAV